MVAVSPSRLLTLLFLWFPSWLFFTVDPPSYIKLPFLQLSSLLLASFHCPFLSTGLIRTSENGEEKNPVPNQLSTEMFWKYFTVLSVNQRAMTKVHSTGRVC